MIRPARKEDTAKLLPICKRLTLLRPELRPDIEKIHGVLKTVIGDSRHFAWVSEDRHGVSGLLLGVTNDNLWAQRRNNAIVAWSAEIPGDGVAMLRHYRDWIKSSRSIKMAGIVDDFGVDPRALKIAQRAGFEKHGGCYLLYN